MDDLDVDPAAIALPRKKSVVYKVVLTGGIIFYICPSDCCVITVCRSLCREDYQSLSIEDIL